ncbi:MAG: KpsF/GutQ family sugar-phosphate isomerase [Phycisphaerales bacterium]|nr:KpsF/GutQ family sugar-phosphate isomerase [Phycisphaerales bacterium]
MSPEREELQFARSILEAEARAIDGVARHLSADFSRAVELIDRCAVAGGTVLVTGLGKSGLIGAKISATLASMGIPSHGVHPSEAAHGDLGRFRPTDTVIAISFSGETEEVVNLAAVLHQDNLPIISITGGGSFDDPKEAGSLERIATVALRLGVIAEAAGVAPTCSTTATLALGDALALAAARRRNYSDNDFAKRHPGGSLGGLLRPVIDVMRFTAGHNLPVATHTTILRAALQAGAAIARRPGAMLLVDPASGRLTGIFTDGDLRRLVLNNPAGLDQPAQQSMTPKPRALPDTALVRDAVHMIQENRQDEIPIVDKDGKPVGILDVQDLIAMRLVRSD